ncbi:hypothetical protein F7R12_27410 [Pseudomonas tolaasii]|nr:hypothetical protein B5P22_08255 [Pseudomonas tolaasii]KAB0466773.1 hypothetical protein F7R12_27410 [Pseudomonas tolaasii]
MSHHLEAPIAHEYRGHILFLKFEWRRPNDKSPRSVTVIEPASINGLGEVAADLHGPWDDYQSAISEAMSAAERWVDSQLP